MVPILPRMACFSPFGAVLLVEIVMTSRTAAQPSGAPRPRTQRYSRESNWCKSRVPGMAR